MPWKFQMPRGKRWVPVTIQELVGELDGAGQEVQTWKTKFTDRAAIEPMSGRELLTAGLIQSEATTQIYLHYRAGVTAKMRIVYVNGTETHTYHIQSVANVEMRNRLMLAYCIERPLEATSASD